jgi:diguanylate cyclase (GGDEF)-like protein
MLEVNNKLPDILIVDDDSSVIITLNKVLNKIGRIRFASDAKQAFIMINERHPDLILLDVELPDILGLEVCSILKNDEATASIPILFITSNMEEGFEEKVFNAGAADYIAKPLKPRIVASRVKTHLDYHRAIHLLEKLAHTDSMTGLANRRTFDEHLNQELKRCRREHIPLTVALIDIDEFKKYNDHFGHVEGDECIKTIASAIKSGSRRPGDLAARYGGEEFAYILPHTDIEGAKMLLNGLLSTIENLNIPHAPAAQYDAVTISIGFSTILPLEQSTFDSTSEDLYNTAVVQSADTALYSAKQNGRNCMRFNPHETVSISTQVIK